MKFNEIYDKHMKKNGQSLFYFNVWYSQGKFELNFDHLFYRKISWKRLRQTGLGRIWATFFKAIFILLYPYEDIISEKLCLAPLFWTEHGAFRKHYECVS